ncbi:MAG: adenylyl-sulfate kinase [Streptosporangiales bacterium]|nr:adenylyl-sulfate kinase [Streptosporangiales bacterium]
MADDTGAPPAFALDPRALADTELLRNGALAPLDGFLGEDDVHAVVASGRLSDGTAWPVPVTLPVPADVADAAASAGALVLEDPEGTPVATLRVKGRWSDGATSYLAGPVEPGGASTAGVFRHLHRPPAEVAAELAGDRPVLGVVVDRPLHHPDLAAIRRAAAGLGDGRVLLLVPTAGDRMLPPESLVRLALAARDRLPDAAVVAVRLARRDRPDHDLALTALVARRYGTALLAAPGTTTGMAGTAGLVAPPPVAYDEREQAWRPEDEVPAGDRRPPLAAADVERLLAAGEPLPEWYTPPEVAAELAHVRPPLTERGVTVFFTGLSGSGKSTIARALYDALTERADRTVTLLDGDVVRRMLSAGLGFSRTDRDRNILRIGFVAAEVNRHGGLAICAPIAPYAATRAAVREMVTAAGGGFVLVHVATSLEVSEARDRKGLYAKARAGLIPEFTGVSDPYEPPTDADLRIDTAEVPVAEAVRAILAHLEAAGYLRALPK